MRTDTTITKRQIICPNSTLLGYSTHKARVGRWIQFSTADDWTGQTRIGRMIGNVSAPAISPNEEPVKNWLLVMVLNSDLTSCGQLWVKPERVMAIYTKRPRKFLNWFTGAWPKDPKLIIQLSELGTLSEQHIHLVKSNIQSIQNYNKERA